MTKSGDTITYTGVVTDGPKVLTPYKRNITIVLTPTRTSAQTIYQTAINTQKALGYQEYLKTDDSSYSYWIATLGARSSSNPSNRVFNMLNEPASYGALSLPDSSGFSNGYIHANTKDYFEVITDTSTAITSETTYTNVKGFSIKYPSDWGKPQEQSNGSFVVFLTPNNNETENLNVQVVNRAGATLATVTEEVKSNAQGYDNFQQIEATSTTLAGLPAYKIVYTATVDGDQLKVAQIVTIKDGKAYVITYKGAPTTNYDKYLGAAQQMIDSLQIQ